MPPRNEPTTRTCIVTREALPAERLIQFVAAPDGAVVPDLRRRLPGRGVWVTADADPRARPPSGSGFSPAASARR